MIDFMGNFISNKIHTLIKRSCRCTHCTDKHCEKYETNLCATCIAAENKEDEDDDEDEIVNSGPVRGITFPLCGHTSCNGFLEVGDSLDYCRPCTIANSKREKETKIDAQKLLQRDDTIVLKTVQQHLKSEMFKTTVTKLFSHSGIPQYDALEPTQKKLKVNN
jgi:hypothetical protein